MDRRRALATVAAVVCSGTALAVAVGATAQVFDAAEASPGVGQVSPVRAKPGPPVVEHRTVDVIDPPLPVPAPTPAPPMAPRRDRATTATTPPTVAPAPAPAPSAAPPVPTTVAPHEREVDDD